MREQPGRSVFEQTILTHLDAAYNLARWLTRNESDAEDVVQEACLRAFKFFGNFRGGDSRSWLLTIVRNTFYTLRQQNKMKEHTTVFDEERHVDEDESPTPEMILIERVNSQMLNAAIEELPAEYREVLILRELEGYSYKEIADMADVPIGTVMSRLARARRQLHRRLAGRSEKEE